MTRKQRFQLIIDYFSRSMPEPETELQYEDPFQLLVSVILAAQCTDKRVNLVTPPLFAKYPDAESMATAEFDDINPFIKSISFANNKTRHLMGTAKMLRDFHNGQVPDTVEELIKLPGVGRKTANVITSVVWEQPNMAVDTHVFRVAQRIGLTLKAKNPLDSEQQLIAYLPAGLVHKAHHWLILHGRYVCLARRPLCEQCGITEACAFYGREMRDVVEGRKTMSEVDDAGNKVNTAGRKG